MSKEYTAAMIVIGNEILSGRTQDVNINYVAKKLVERGIILSQVRIIPDIEAEIIGAINDLKNKVDYVFTTGGIGPTHDDITAQSVANAFGLDLEVSEQAKEFLLNHYDDGSGELSSSRLKMAKVPVGASLIPNPISGAAGFIVENIYVMAGVPAIMQAMMDHVVLMLKGGEVAHSRTVFCDLGESVIAHDLGVIQSKYKNVDIGSYPYFAEGRRGVNIVLRSCDGDSLDLAEKAVSLIVEKMVTREN